jgi:hypothetical protein
MRILALLLAVLMPAAGLKADTKKLTDDQRIEIIRGLSAEYGKIKVLLPKSKKPLEFSADGHWDQAKWQASAKELGPAGRVGDLIQVTKVEIEKDRILLELNGGMRSQKKWYDHIEVGMGNSTRPVTNSATNAPDGTNIVILFDGSIGQITSGEIKKMLAPVLDFDKQSVTEDYVESLPEPIREAIKANKAIEGMDRDQVILAIGKPLRKNRENKDGTEFEDWIYGEPPGRITFVTFGGAKVVKVKETYAGMGGAVSGTPAPVR